MSRTCSPGDLVFFNTRRFAFSHVGIYLGENRFVHAPRRGREVEVATFDSRFLAEAVQRCAADGRRDCPSLIPSLVGEARRLRCRSAAERVRNGRTAR